MRLDGCVYYLETKPPDQVVIDWDVIAAAPPSIRTAGICDVLSIATGSWDWRFAEEKGRNPPGMEYAAWADQVAASILHAALDCAEAAGRGDPAGLKQLLDCLVLETQLCNQLGHARPEEGSEHYFAYAVEGQLDMGLSADKGLPVGEGLPHGDLVGPGILLMAERQGQDVVALRRALEACHVPLDRILTRTVEATLRLLPEYVRRQYGELIRAFGVV